METTAANAKGKISEMTKVFTEMSLRYNKMTEQEKQQPFGKALAASIEELKTKIKDSKAELDDVTKSLNGGGGMGGALDSIASKFGGATAALTAAMKVAKDAFFQSESGIDEWGRTVEGAKGAYSVFLDTINNGNWSGFFDNLSRAIQGGRDLYDAFDRLNSIKLNNSAAIAILQNKIAELRLAKQNGGNVDADIKAAAQQLAALQGQSISAGKTAGTKSAYEVIRNGVNSVGGTGINDATINYAIDRIMRMGQAEFDKYKRNYDVLQKRGTTLTTKYSSTQYGGTIASPVREFNINNLTKEEQKQYALAKAITEGETRIQKGISAYAQAVQQGTSAAREEFKSNRYALTGGSRSGVGGHTGGTTGPTYAPDSLAAQAALVSEIKKLWMEAGEGLRDQYLVQLVAAENKLKQMNNEQALLKEQANGKLLGGSVQTTGLGSVTGYMSVGEGLGKDFKLPTSQIEDMTEALKQQHMAFNMAGQAAQNFGAALASIEDPGAKAAGTVISAIANIALGFSQAAAQASSMGPYGWIAYVAAGLATMATAISTVHSLTGYAQGGIVKGNSYSGDNMMFGGDGLYGLNAGELILNRSQQNSIANQLEGNGIGNLNLHGVLQGENILISIDRTLQRQGRELAVWGRGGNG